MADLTRDDEITPGGKYLNAAGDRYHDANGIDLGPVACDDCDCADGTCAIDSPDLPDEPQPDDGTQAEPKRARARKADA